MRKRDRRILLLVVIAFFTGCSLDMPAVISYPEEVKPEKSTNVMLSNSFVFFDTSEVRSIGVTRDSIHLLIGMPSSWSVESASCVVLKDFNINDYYSMIAGENLVDSQTVKELEDLIPPSSEFIPMSKDENLISFIKNKELVAYSPSQDESLSVAINNIPKWEGFSAPVNIVLEKGKRNDLVIGTDSFASASGSSDEISGLKPPFLGKVKIKKQTPNFDSMGITMVPVIISVNLKAGKEESKDTIFYFTKTAAMNEPPSPTLAMIGALYPEASSMLQNNLIFTPINVTETANIKEALKGKKSGKNIWSEQKRGSLVIRYNKNRVNPIKAEVYSLKGNFIKNIKTDINESCFKWDGTNNFGAKVCKGIYYVKVFDRNGTIFTQSINILE